MSRNESGAGQYQAGSGALAPRAVDVRTRGDTGRADAGSAKCRATCIPHPRTARPHPRCPSHCGIIAICAFRLRFSLWLCKNKWYIQTRPFCPDDAFLRARAPPPPQPPPAPWSRPRRTRRPRAPAGAWRGMARHSFTGNCELKQLFFLSSYFLSLLSLFFLPLRIEKKIGGAAKVRGSRMT